jgi:very-short-patch-repair endonuclease
MVLPLLFQALDKVHWSIIHVYTFIIRYKCAYPAISFLFACFLWMQVRAAKMMGYQFNRQKPLGEFIVDFYCRRLNLVIEVDGACHFYPGQVVKDENRQIILQRMSLNFLRFTERQVIQQSLN